MLEAKKELTRGSWLRILTSPYINAKDIALLENCSMKKAYGIVKALNSTRKSVGKTCKTDDYLRLYKGTTRKDEIALIYNKEEQA